MFIGHNEELNCKKWITVLRDPETKYPIVHGCLKFIYMENGNFLPVLCFQVIHKEGKEEDTEEYRLEIQKYKDTIKQKAKYFLNGGVVVDALSPDEIDYYAVKSVGVML